MICVEFISSGLLINPGTAQPDSISIFRQFQDSQIEVFVQVITQVYKMESAIADCSVVTEFKARKRHFATGKCTQETMTKLVDG